MKSTFLVQAFDSNVPDVDPTGFTKWGVQDSDDPNYVNWRIRVNRYAKHTLV